MEQFFADYTERLQSLHNDMKGTFAALPQAALDWVPGSDMLSFCVIVVHTTGAERYWVGDVAGQDPSGRNRAAEFKMKGLGAAELIKRLDQSLDFVKAITEKLKLDSLREIRNSSRDGRKITVGWALAHALEHTALHLGHAQISRQLWERKSGL